MKQNGSVVDINERLETLLGRFRLWTVQDELIGRLRQAGHDGALDTIVEVFELEEAARRERRVARLRTASKLPPGKTFDTLERDRFST